MTKFRDGFMMKSPIPAHDAIMDKMKAKSKESSGRDDAPDYSNAEVADLKKDYDKAKAEHDSPASMSPLNQGGYVGGGMSASDYAPVGDLYMNMFNSISSAAREYDENKNDPEVQARSKAMKAQRLGKRIDKIDSKLPKNTGETYTYINDEGKEVEEFFVDPTLNAKQIGKRNKLQGKRADALVDQTQFEDIAKQNKQNDYNSLIANMTEADKKKYGIIT
jgi:hypothetical protein